VAEQHDKTAEFIELHAPEARTQFICARTLRACQDGRMVGIYAPDPDAADELDQRLWTFQQNAFIPHVILAEADEPLIEPVVIFADDPGELEFDLVILATDGEMPPWFDRFDNICDFAQVYDDDLLEVSRARFAACKAAGYHMLFTRPQPAGQ
jgi:DNA polymerase-3 subunit chi